MESAFTETIVSSFGLRGDVGLARAGPALSDWQTVIAAAIRTISGQDRFIDAINAFIPSNVWTDEQDAMFKKIDRKVRSTFLLMAGIGCLKILYVRVLG